MAIVHLLRHAKSSWEHLGADHDRPLAPRGERAAAAIGVFMQQEGIAPDMVLCSTARRTRQTLDAIEPYLPDNTDVQFEPRIYEASALRLLEIIRAADVDEVLVIGHNPGTHSVALALVGSGDSDAMSRLRGKYPTAGLCSIAFDSDLSRLNAGEGELLRFESPKTIV